MFNLFKSTKNPQFEQMIKLTDALVSATKESDGEKILAVNKQIEELANDPNWDVVAYMHYAKNHYAKKAATKRVVYAIIGTAIGIGLGHGLRYLLNKNSIDSVDTDTAEVAETETSAE